MDSLQIVGSTSAEAGCCAPTREAVLPRSEADRYALVLKAVADPVRIQLLMHLAASCCSTACVCHMPDLLGISQPTLSHHLKKLTEAGLVHREMRGRWAHYTLNSAAFIEMTRILASFGQSKEE